ncbi:MAG: iron-containing alcohol dehydrogenase [Planctomycetaceae bacterium]|nr:iron-containing alcohol dehydrogenase [Planctomycetaceae bacterium]
MSLAFQLLLPRKVVFGLGKRSELGSLASCLGRRAFLIDGSRTLHDSPFWIEILEPLRTAGIVVEHIATASREPTIADVDETANHVRRLKPHSGDFLIGLGGGSAMDLAKAVSAMATNTKSPTVRDYLEGVGTGLSLTNPPLPMLAIPTTAGTGTEATKNAVISVDAPPVKKSLRSEQMVPAAVLIDPELTVPNSPAQTAASGMDAITQLLESFFSRRSQPVTDALCLDGLVKALPAIESAYQNGSDLAARSAMSYAAFLSGVALANSGLGMAHGVAAALGAINDVPHGLACAVMLPVTLKTNEAVILEKVSLLNRHLEANGLPGDILGTISQLSRSLAIPEKLRDLGVQQEQLPAIVAGSRGNSMSGNPRDLTDQELTQILEAAW